MLAVVKTRLIRLHRLGWVFFRYNFITIFQKISRNWLYLLFFILSRTLICQDLREKWCFEIEVFPKQLFSQETVRHTQECVGCELGMRICAYFFEVGTIFDRDHNKTIELACFFDTNYSNPNWDFFHLMFIFLKLPKILHVWHSDFYWLDFLLIVQESFIVNFCICVELARRVVFSRTSWKHFCVANKSRFPNLSFGARLWANRKHYLLCLILSCAYVLRQFCSSVEDKLRWNALSNWIARGCCKWHFVCCVFFGSDKY